MLNRISSAIATALNPPEWMTQELAVSRGEATWEDFSFEQRTCKGWLLPYLVDIDAHFSGRWAYWTDTLLNGAPLDQPIPRIDFLDQPNPQALKCLTDCLKAYNRYDFRLSDFLEWLLWGFGEGEERPRITADANEFLYRTFNLGPLLQHPHDYIGHILTKEKAGYWNNPNAFYPTPHCVCHAMAEMTFADALKKGEDLKTKSVLDPCVGTGRMLMYASNYSLFLHGIDIDRTCVNACKVNGFLYMPWLVRSGLKRLDIPEEEIPEAEIVPEVPAIEWKPVSVEEKQSMKMHQLTLF